MSENNHLCQYTDRSGCQCNEVDAGNGLCYWHDKTIDKTGSDVKTKLEAYAKSGGLLRGICLKRADLANIDLVNHHQKQGYDFSFADLYKANLNGAHLFNINLSHASVMKADLRFASLNCATLKHTNLLGARWADSKIENIKIGRKLKQELEGFKAQKNKQREQAIDYFEQAEEIYRDLRKHAEHEGIFTLAGAFIQKELTMRRMQLPKYSAKRITSKIVDLFCGYGEAPLRIVGISICMIICCAVLYSFTGLNYQGQVQVISSDASFKDNISLFFSCLYYSVVTFTTLGYGDFTPIGISRAIAAFEAFTGSFTIALFVVVFVKKMTR
ncbi:pentapeptide repeat-containing protein [Thalassotalea sp. M1531]|uniref:Pentapeptide repeat-containing protein n=1 Tax=Thalassotalea algicola TaxID=2716224 RepID=A0A7Y0Q8U8_9GAMM|nr:ion channel [Thalassotalea algicola]NMP32540.1 pentapeptide repeat-containing protein [Thalassotalea algicola]